MSEVLSILSVGLGTLLAIVVAAFVIFWFIEDVTQKKHAVLRNYPLNMLYPYPQAKNSPLLTPEAGPARSKAGAQFIAGD